MCKRLCKNRGQKQPILEARKALENQGFLRLKAP
jgi:hypothetical protein